MKCEMGVVFEVATIVGVKLFGSDEKELSRHVFRSEEKLALLPKAVRKKSRVLGISAWF